MKFGYIKNPKGHQRTLFAVHAAAAVTTTPPSASCEPFSPEVLDQGDTGSCTGHGTATGIATAFAACGVLLPFLPSPAEIYRNGRAIDRVRRPDGLFDKLEDEGAMPNQVLRAVHEYGVRGTSALDGKSSDVDPATVNDEPKLGDLEVEHFTIPVGEYAIRSVEDGAALASVVENMRKALSAAPHGLPVGAGTFVDTAFMNWDGTQPPLGACNQNDPDGGGHWFCFLGYRTDAHGKTIFRIRNSWGQGWGLGGDIEVTEAFLAHCTDLSVYVAKKASF